MKLVITKQCNYSYHNRVGYGSVVLLKDEYRDCEGCGKRDYKFVIISSSLKSHNGYTLTYDTICDNEFDEISLLELL